MAPSIRQILRNIFKAVFIAALFSITFLDDNTGLAGLAMTVRSSSSLNRLC
jgi:hypothetical protein